MEVYICMVYMGVRNKSLVFNVGLLHGSPCKAQVTAVRAVVSVHM